MAFISVLFPERGGPSTTVVRPGRKLPVTLQTGSVTVQRRCALGKRLPLH